MEGVPSLKLFSDRSVEGFENDRDQVVALGAFDLFECLDVFVFGAVHDGEDLGQKMRFIAGPLAARTGVTQRLQEPLLLGLMSILRNRLPVLKLDLLF